MSAASSLPPTVDRLSDPLGTEPVKSPRFADVGFGTGSVRFKLNRRGSLDLAAAMVLGCLVSTQTFVDDSREGNRRPVATITSRSQIRVKLHLTGKLATLVLGSKRDVLPLQALSTTVPNRRSFP